MGRKPKILTLDGKTQTITAWAKERGITPHCIRGRLKKGMSIREALFSGNCQKDKAKKYPYRNENKTLDEWSQKAGIPADTLYRRIVHSGWPMGEALSTPLGQRRKTYSRKCRINLTIRGIIHSIDEWCKIKNACPTLTRQRLRRGWDAERALTHPKKLQHNNGQKRGKTRICNTCREEKPKKDFAPDNRVRDGVATICKTCCRKHAQEYTEKRAKEFEKIEHTIDIEQIRKCTLCKEEKPLHAYGRVRGAKLGRSTHCKECKRKKARERYHEKRHWINKREKTKRGRVRQINRKGMTSEEYHFYHDLQNGKCLICGKPAVRKSNDHLDIDHDHNTGLARGLLCNRCNPALGSFQEDPTIFVRALAYLLIAKEKKDIVTSEDLEGIDRRVPLIIKILSREKIIPVKKRASFNKT